MATKTKCKLDKRFKFNTTSKGFSVLDIISEDEIIAAYVQEHMEKSTDSVKNETKNETKNEDPFLSLLSGGFVASMFDDGIGSEQKEDNFYNNDVETEELKCERLINELARGDDSMSRLFNQNYWKQFAPEGITIDYFDSKKKERLSFDNIDKIYKEGLEEDGYTVYPGPTEEMVEVEQFKKMVETVRILKKAGWPPAFAFVFDQFWEILVRAHSLAKACIGEDCVLEPSVFIWSLEKQQKNKKKIGQNFGLPHRDYSYEESFFEDGSPTIFNVWIPLTESTIDNGCLYVLPKEFDDIYDKPNDIAHMRSAIPGTLSYEENVTKVRIDIGSARPVPCSRGSIISWYGPLVHWGSRCHRSCKEPRTSIACTFRNPNAKVTHLIDGSIEDITYHNLTNLNLRTRLRLIAKAIWIYRDWFQLNSTTFPEIFFQEEEEESSKLK